MKISQIDPTTLTKNAADHLSLFMENHSKLMKSLFLSIPESNVMQKLARHVNTGSGHCPEWAQDEQTGEEPYRKPTSTRTVIMKNDEDSGSKHHPSRGRKWLQERIGKEEFYRKPSMMMVVEEEEQEEEEEKEEKERKPVHYFVTTNNQEKNMDDDQKKPIENKTGADSENADVMLYLDVNDDEAEDLFKSKATDAAIVADEMDSDATIVDEMEYALTI